MWTSSFEKDGALVQCRRTLERNGFTVRVDKYGVVVTHSDLVSPWVVRTRSELILIARLYSGEVGRDDPAAATVRNGFTRSKTNQPGSTAETLSGQNRQDADAHLGDRLAALEEENRKLRDAASTSARRQDEWKQRALIAEASAKTNASRLADKRFDAVKRLFAREFHPDQFQGDGLEKLLRTEIFKQFWPKIEAIEGGRDF